MHADSDARPPKSHVVPNPNFVLLTPHHDTVLFCSPDLSAADAPQTAVLRNERACSAPWSQ
jgi:hypothetical protein